MGAFNVFPWKTAGVTMSHVDSYIQSQLDRFQRFLNHIGFQVQMKVLHSFWIQAQSQIQKKDKNTIQPCSFICFHCCTDKKDKKQITKCKKSTTQSYRHRCSHACACNKANHFHKTGTSKECTSNNPKNGLLNSSDHSLTDFCGLVYDPMCPDKPTINKWLDWLEKKYGTQSNESSESDSESDSDSNSVPTHDQSTHNSTTVVNTMTYAQALKVLEIKKKENEKKLLQQIMDIEFKYQQLHNQLNQNKFLCVWNMHKMAKQNGQMIENEIRKIKHNLHKRNAVITNHCNRQKTTQKCKELKEFKIVPFKLSLADNICTFDLNEKEFCNHIRKPKCAFALYNAFRHKQLSKIPLMTVKEMDRISSEAWDAFNESEKFKWKKKAEIEKIEYDKIVTDLQLQKRNDLNKIPVQWKNEASLSKTDNILQLHLPNLNRFTETKSSNVVFNKCMKSKRKRKFDDMNCNGSNTNEITNHAQKRRFH